MKPHFFSLTDVGILRDHNEDAIADPHLCGALIPPNAIDTHGYLFAVADGMGGHEGGEVASAIALSTLFDTYYRTPDDVHEGLVASFAAANQAVFRAARERLHERFPDFDEPTDPSLLMGTTLVAAAVVDRHAVVANIGDSRAYILHNATLRRITVDHSLAAEHVRRGVLTEEQAFHVRYRNVLLRAVGHTTDVTADLFDMPIAAGDRLMLSSDGLHGVVGHEEIRDILRGTGDLSDAARRLIRRANELGGPDNISVIIVAL